MTTQERLGKAIDKALDEGFIDSFNYREFDNSRKIIGGCAQSAALKGLGCTDEQINAASFDTNSYASLANAPNFLMWNINSLHCVGKVTARAIAGLLKENKIPEVEVWDEVLVELAAGLPTRKGEYTDWNRGKQ